MENLEFQVSATEDIRSEAWQRLEVFVKAYVSEFEEKLKEYAKEAKVGGTAKSGKISRNVVGPVSSAIGATGGAALGAAASVLADAAAGVLAFGRAGFSAGKGAAKEVIAPGSMFFIDRGHRNKAKKITQIFQTVKTDERRKMFVEAATLICYSFQSQFENVTDADGNWQRALSKLAIDARDRSISYIYNVEKDSATAPEFKNLLTKGLILGESKDTYLSHVTPKKWQRIISKTKPGHTVKIESKQWKTSDIYEKVGIKIAGNNDEVKYYKKKTSGTDDYGYRWSFNWENDDSSWISNYNEVGSNVSEDPQTSIKLEEFEAKMVEILTNINKDDPKLQLDRIEDGVKTIVPMKQVLDEINTKLPLELPTKSDEPKIFTVKEPVKTFTGRIPELSQLHDKLQTLQKHVVVSQTASISGLGGVGKSELARKYACEYHESYGSCIWIDSETESSITQSFHRLAEKLQIDGERNILLIVEDIYKRFSNSKTLFIFDNVDQYEAIEDFLPSNLSPTDEKPTIIITSRNSDWDIGDEGDIGLILLDQFTPDEAFSFVKRVLEIDDEDKSHDSVISELTELLCYFPLALRQAASYVKAKKFSDSLNSIKKYLADFRDEKKKKRDLLKYKTKRDRYTETSYTTWRLTFKNIEEYGANGTLAISLVEIMSYLPPDDISLEAFTKLAGNDENLYEAVDILRKYSIITLNENLDQNYFYRGKTANIHRLVQQVIRLWLQEEKREEDVLWTALTEIHDYALSNSVLWSFACNYTTLIDNYFRKICEETKSYKQFVIALYYLAKDGDVRTIKKIVDHLEGRNDLCCELNSQILEMGLVKTTRPVKDSKSILLFHAEVTNALKHSNTEDLESFLQNFDKSLINSWLGGFTALQRPAETGKLNVVKILVENGADVNLKSCFHDTPVRLAIMGKHFEVVKYLIDHGADINETNKMGWTLLDCACHHGDLKIVKLLVDTIATRENGSEAFWKPLNLAAESNDVEIVEFLINHEVYRSAMDDHVRYRVCHAAIRRGSIEVAKYLFDNKLANVNDRDYKNETNLFTAVRHDQFDIVKYLLSEGADVNAFNDWGFSPLLEAACKDDINIARYLIQHGAAIDNVHNRRTLPGQLNISALHAAAAFNRIEMVKFLVEQCNVDINIGLNTAFSPLQVAMYLENKQVCEFLISRGADTTEWSNANLKSVVCIFQNFCKENNFSIDDLKSECKFVIDKIKRCNKQGCLQPSDFINIFEPAFPLGRGFWENLL